MKVYPSSSSNSNSISRYVIPMTSSPIHSNGGNVTNFFSGMNRSYYITISLYHYITINTIVPVNANVKSSYIHSNCLVVSISIFLLMIIIIIENDVRSDVVEDDSNNVHNSSWIRPLVFLSTMDRTETDMKK